MKFIKIYGLPRSCTNVTETLLNKNFSDLRVLNNFPDWKHGFNNRSKRSVNFPGKVVTDDLKFVVCIKNPVDWLWSLYSFNKCKQNGISPNQFLKSTVDNYKNKPAAHYAKYKWTPIDAFNVLNKHWLEMHDDPSIIQIVRQEDLRDNQEEILERIRQNFRLVYKKGEPCSIKSKVMPACKISSSSYEPRKHEFNGKDLSFIKSNLDKNLLMSLQYTV